MTLEALAHSVKNSVTTVDELAGGIEALGLTLAVRAAVWGAAVPTITLSARTIGVVFELEPSTSLASSVALELVGQSVVNAWLKAREWNTNKNKSDPAANEKLLLGFSALYFISDFLLVSALEVPLALAGEWVHLTALLFPLMQVVSTVITAERAAQYRREAVAIAAKAERSAKRTVRHAKKRRSDSGQKNGQKPRVDRSETMVNNDLGGTSERSISDNLDILTAANQSRSAKRQAALTALINAFTDDPHLSYAEAGRRVDRSKSWVAGAVSELEGEGVLQRANGDGVLVLHGYGNNGNGGGE